VRIIEESEIMRLIPTVRALAYSAAFCLFVVPSLGSRSASAAQTETLDNGVVTATFEDGALMRLRNAASKRVLELSGDSATLTVNGEQFAAPGRKLIATERLAVQMYAVQLGALALDANVEPRAAIQQIANLDLAADLGDHQRPESQFGTLMVNMSYGIVNMRSRPSGSVRVSHSQRSVLSRAG
jgi:hypothetical protein